MGNPQAIEFESKVSMKEATRCCIVRYSATTKEIYSWKAEMPKSDDFEEASQKFRAIYNSLQHLSIKINGISAVFKAEFIKPSESIKFTTIVFDSDKTPELKKLKVALVLENEMLEWLIKIQVYE